ncbi:hypothetical protein AV530_012931 [Patagioenas fasciata monilis]|uniref:Uncharacterized protein n=1 Tax=Patagioenas fasciata monilis TaxID=372326 RepID=A0A1V4J9Y7_PATFA|nr:hypothetical protein AV530_012931 [Patagioenas fasciata monilis]
MQCPLLVPGHKISEATSLEIKDHNSDVAGGNRTQEMKANLAKFRKDHFPPGSMDDVITTQDRYFFVLKIACQLPCLVQLCSAAGAQHGCLQPRRDLGQPEL